MGSRVIHIIHNSKLFLASRGLISRLKVVHVNYNLELFMVFGVVSSQLEVVHVMHNLELMTRNRSYHLHP